MTTQNPSWIARLVAGNELQQAAEALHKQAQQRAELEASLAELRSRLADVESELKVRTDIMNVTSIVSEADKKGDILSVNDKFIEVTAGLEAGEVVVLNPRDALGDWDGPAPAAAPPPAVRPGMPAAG